MSDDAAPPTQVTENDAAPAEVSDFVADDSLPQGRGKRNLTWWRLAMIAFVFTCSGPGGLEQVLMAGGAWPAVLGIFLVPIFYVMPQIFVVSECGAMMPTGAGNVVWVHRAFGRAAGFYNAWVFSVTNSVDVAAYPALFGDYVVSTFYPEASYRVQMAWRMFGLVLGAILALASAKDVSSMTAVGCVTVTLFAVIMFCAAADKIEPSKQWGQQNATIDYSLLGSALMWLYTGWSAIGALAGETKSSRVLLHGMSAALGVDLVVYILCLAAALAVTTTVDWQAGMFVTVMDRLIPGAATYFGISVIIGSMTLYLSAITCYSRTVWGMAEMGWAPTYFRKQLSNGAPHTAVFANFCVAFALIWFDLGFIVQIEYTVAAASYIITYLAFLKLRYSEPNTPRPYTVPGGMPFAWLITITKVIIMGATMIAGLMDWRILIAFILINGCVAAGYVVLLRVQPVDHHPRGYDVEAATSAAAQKKTDGDEPDQPASPDPGPASATIAMMPRRVATPSEDKDGGNAASSAVQYD